MAMVRAAANNPLDVIEVGAAEVQQALDAVGAQGEVGKGGFGKVYAAELPCLPRRGRVAIKRATGMTRRPCYRRWRCCASADTQTCCRC